MKANTINLKKGIVTLIVLLIIYFITDILFISTGKHSIEFEKANSCFWMFKDSNLVNNENMVVFVGKEDSLYKFQYKDSLRIIVHEFSNINNADFNTSKNKEEEILNGENKIESYDFESFILKFKLSFKIDDSLNIKVILKGNCKNINGKSYKGITSTINDIKLYNKKIQKGELLFTKIKRVIFLLVRRNNTYYYVLVEGRNDVEVTDKTLNIFTFV
jgi:hypothetical protein